ncbi:hypothetical protein [Fodinicola acaciae]|uniref:hypothetical protein n=1 Tax=Fodinicola acaciae TaxID=2681555 RepID=UPI0013D0EC00|nr:hypothetical protein [Fodinicola acaciae]
MRSLPRSVVVALSVAALLFVVQQKINMARSTDEPTWSDFRDVVNTGVGDRPGMPNIRWLPGGS